MSDCKYSKKLKSVFFKENLTLRTAEIKWE